MVINFITSCLKMNLLKIGNINCKASVVSQNRPFKKFEMDSFAQLLPQEKKKISFETIKFNKYESKKKFLKNGKNISHFQQGIICTFTTWILLQQKLPQTLKTYIYWLNKARNFIQTGFFEEICILFIFMRDLFMDSNFINYCPITWGMFWKVIFSLFIKFWYS